MLIPEGDESALTAAIAELLDDSDLAGRLGAAAATDAERFSSARIADQYLKLFSSL